jgi:hypothetical protein
MAGPNAVREFRTAWRDYSRMEAGKKMKYEIDDRQILTTPCPYRDDTRPVQIMVGSTKCEQCQYYHGEQNHIVNCGKEYENAEKI